MQEEQIKDLKKQDEGDIAKPKINRPDEEIRLRLRNHFLQQKTDVKELPEMIVNSTVVKTLKQNADMGEGVSATSKVWKTFEKTFNNELPHFEKIVTQLAGRSLKSQEYTTLMLIKCGFTPTEIATLIFRGKSTVSYYRRELSRKLFGIDVEPNVFYQAIRNI